LRSDGVVLGWGSNQYGQCNVPVLPSGMRYELLTAGNSHSLALRSDGAVVAWGSNFNGQCNVPALPSGMRYQAVAAGLFHSLALRSDGAVVAWGDNYVGKCNVPPLPSIGLKYEAIGGGWFHSIALRSDGTIAVWGGMNDAATLSNDLWYEAVAAGDGHCLAIVGMEDCDRNGIADDQDLASGAPDCNSNLEVDSCEVVYGFAADCNLNNIPDSCDIAFGIPDCNLNAVPDVCDIAFSTSADADFNQIPDECSLDCNSNGLVDTAEIAAGLTPDCNTNQIPDTCDLAAGVPDCNANQIPDSCDTASGTTPDCDANSIPDACQFAAGAPDCNANGQLDSCDAQVGPDCNGNLVPDSCDPDTNADAIPDDCQDGGTPYCTGVGPAGGGVACPCGNIGLAGHGCPNSQNPGGARLEALGLPSRVADTMVLRGSGMPASATMMYFQGTGQSPGIVFGDGLRCATGFTVRLGFTTNVNGASQWPPAGGVAIHVGGQIPASGSVQRYYQGWYRDVAESFCTVNRYNLTNGVAVVWVP